MRNKIMFLLIIISIWIVLVLLMFLIPGCDYNQTKVGDITKTRMRCLMYDSTEQESWLIQDGNSIVIYDANGMLQYPKANIKVKVNPLLNDYEVTTGEGVK